MHVMRACYACYTCLAFTHIRAYTCIHTLVYLSATSDPVCLFFYLSVHLSIYLPVSTDNAITLHGELRAASALPSGLGNSFPCAEADGPSHNAGRPEQEV